MNLGKVKQVRFHQAIRMKSQVLQSINIENKAEAQKFDLNFVSGLLRVKSKKTGMVAYVGLANICYMIVEEDKVVNTPVENEVVSNEKVEIELSDLNAGEAIKMVRATDKKEVLEVWKDIETRSSVIKEIDKKLK